MKYTAFLKFSLFSIILVAGIAVFGSHAYAATSQLYGKNITNGALGSSFTNAVYSDAGDTLEWQIFYNDVTAISSISVTLPSDITYSQTTTAQSASVSGQTITWTFSGANTVLVRFRTLTKAGNQLSATHTSTFNFTTGGDTVITSVSNPTLRIGPAITSVTPSNGTDLSATDVTLVGHGFTSAGDIAGITINGQSVIPGTPTVTSNGDGTYTVTDIRVQAGLTPGVSYPFVFNTTVNGKTLSTGTSTSNTVQFSISDGVGPVFVSLDSYIHLTGKLLITLNEAVSPSATVVGNIQLFNAAVGGNSIALTGSTVASGSTTSQLAITLAQSQINTVSGWYTAGTLYADILANTIFDSSNNAMSAFGARTAVSVWTKDATAPTVSSLTITQGANTNGSVRAGIATISLTLSEVASTTPVISINQPGTTDVANAAMTDTGDATTFTYVYTVTASSTPAYLDGAAAITISGAQDYGGNTMVSDAGNSVTIDTSAPTNPASIATSGAASSEAPLLWTPAYSGSDFSTYKIYYGTTSGVTSASASFIDKATTGYTALGSANTSGITVSGLSATVTYYFVLYSCDLAGNCAGPSAELERAGLSTGGGGGPSGGGGGSPAPSTASVSKTISPSGDTLTAEFTGHQTVSVAVPAFSSNNGLTIVVREPFSGERSAIPTATQGVTLLSDFAYYNITAADANGAQVTSFPNGLTITISYNPAVIPAGRISELRVGYYNAATGTWVSLPSVLDESAKTISTNVAHLTMYAPVLSTIADETDSVPPAAEPPAPDEAGIVLGSSVGIYPNGALLKTATSPSVWYIENDQKHPIQSAEVFLSRFEWKHIVVLPSSRQLDLYEASDPVLFAPGSLVKAWGKPAVYRVTTEKTLQPIVSATVFANRGYSFSEVYDVHPDVLASYAIVEPITTWSAIYSGDVITTQKTGTPLSPLYYVNGIMLNEVRDLDVFFTRKMNAKHVNIVSPEVVAVYAHGSPFAYQDGLLVKGSGSAVYAISDGRKRPIRSGADFEALLYSWINIKTISDALLLAMQNGPALSVLGE